MKAVIKRDGEKVNFDIEKIKNAINKCFIEKRNKECTEINVLLTSICEELILYNDDINVELIQDIVEESLMKHGYYNEAKAYILYRKHKADMRTTYVDKINYNIDVPWGPIGYPTYKRTYARRLNSENINCTEEFKDTILRILNAANSQLNVGFTNKEIIEAYTYMMNLKCSVAGRFLWQLGTQTVDKYGLLSLQNCAFIKIDSPIRPFTWLFDSLMLGVGVGISVEYKHINKLPDITTNNIVITRNDTKDADFILPDTREGWVGILEKVLEAYFYKGVGFSYSTMLIRGAGSLIKGFGGVASGPEELCKGIDNICKILDSRKGKKLTSVNCIDIIDICATITVVGNIRRAAIIILGDYTDIDFLRAKRWDLGNIPNWRCQSNHSVICDDVTQLPNEFWDGYNGNGEPYGLINIDLAKKIGRIKDGEKYSDPFVEGTNPCGEQTLANFETCCLGELFLPNIESFEELKKITTIIYRICKHSLMLKCHHKETENIVHNNMRMGIGITGYAQCTKEQKEWLSPLYEYLREFDDMYSSKHGVNKSIKLTTVKPSGTLSLLPGVTPGCHPGIFKYFIRRVRFSATNNLYLLFKENGYHCEYQQNFDGSLDYNTVIISFPCKYPDNTIFAKDITAIDQLNIMKELQTNWSDNSVSITVYYKKHELDDIKAWLKENYKTCVKGCSFLLHVDHGFVQAPYEEINKEQYDEMNKNIKKIVKSNFIHTEYDNSFECQGGSCPIR